MTDQHDPLDDLASAHLDGQTTGEEAARITADPVLSARVARLAAVRAALQRTATEAVDPAERETAIAAAMAALDDGRVGTVTPLATRPRRSWWTDNRALRLAAAAAAVVLLALAAPLLGRLDSDPDEDVASVESEAGVDEAAPGAGSAGATLEAAEDAAGAFSTTDELGSFDDLPALTAEVRARIASDGATSTRAAPAVPDAGATTAAGAVCADAVAGLEPVSYRAHATFDGRSAVVVVHEDPASAPEVVVLDATSCAELGRARL